jgi:hypothetical protein
MAKRPFQYYFPPSLSLSLSVGTPSTLRDRPRTLRACIHNLIHPDRSSFPFWEHLWVILYAMLHVITAVK